MKAKVSYFSKYKTPSVNYIYMNIEKFLKTSNRSSPSYPRVHEISFRNHAVYTNRTQKSHNITH